MRHRMRLNTDTRDAPFLTLNDSRSSSTKRIQNRGLCIGTESREVIPHQVRRIRQHEPVPIMRRSVLRREFVGVRSDQFIKRWYFDRQSVGPGLELEKCDMTNAIGAFRNVGNSPQTWRQLTLIQFPQNALIWRRCRRRWVCWRFGLLGFAGAGGVEDSPFAGAAAEAGGFVGAEVEFYRVPHVFDECVHFGVEGGGLFFFVVGFFFGAELFGFGGGERVEGGVDFCDGGPSHGAFADLGGVVAA